MRASDFMTTAVLTTTPSESVKAATRQLLERRIAAMPVVDDDGRLVGIVSEVDVLRERVPADPPTHVRTEEPPRTSLPRTVADVMTRDVYALPVGAEHARRRGAVLVPVYVHQPVLGDVPGLGGGFEEPGRAGSRRAPLARAGLSGAGCGWRARPPSRPRSLSATPARR